MYSSNKDVNKIVRNAVKRGMVVRGKGKHLQLSHDKVGIITISTTPKNVQSLGHLERAMKAAGL